MPFPRRSGWHIEVENDQLAVVFFRRSNAGQTIVGFVTAVGGPSFKKLSDGAAHGGIVVNDKDSSLHGSADYYRPAPETIRICVFFHLDATEQTAAPENPMQFGRKSRSWSGRLSSWS